MTLAGVLQDPASPLELLEEGIFCPQVYCTFFRCGRASAHFHDCVRPATGSANGATVAVLLACLAAAKRLAGRDVAQALDGGVCQRFLQRCSRRVHDGQHSFWVLPHGH